MDLFEKNVVLQFARHTSRFCFGAAVLSISEQMFLKNADLFSRLFVAALGVNFYPMTKGADRIVRALGRGHSVDVVAQGAPPCISLLKT